MSWLMVVVVSRCAQVLTNAAMRALLFGTGRSPPPHHHGLLITRVLRRSCAAAAGVRPGDLLLAIDGQTISNEGEVTFRAHERSAHAGRQTRGRLSATALLLRPEWALPLLRGPQASSAARAVEYEYLVTRKQIGETITLSLLRSSCYGAASAHAPFDLNALVAAPAPPAPLELTVTLTPTHELCPRARA